MSFWDEKEKNIVAKINYCHSSVSVRWRILSIERHLIGMEGHHHHHPHMEILLLRAYKRPKQQSTVIVQKTTRRVTLIPCVCFLFCGMVGLLIANKLMMMGTSIRPQLWIQVASSSLCSTAAAQCPLQLQFNRPNETKLARHKRAAGVGDNRPQQRNFIGFQCATSPVQSVTLGTTFILRSEQEWWQWQELYSLTGSNSSSSKSSLSVCH